MVFKLVIDVLFEIHTATSRVISFTNIPANQYTLSLVNNAGTEVHKSVVEIAEGQPFDVSWLTEGLYFIDLMNAATMERHRFKFLKVE